MKNDVTIQLGINYPSKQIDNLKVIANNMFNITLPGGIEGMKKEFDKICNDHEQLGMLLSKNKEIMREIMEETLSGHQISALKKAKSIGLTEEKFQEKGGGLIGWVVVAVVVAVLLYPSEAK